MTFRILFVRLTFGSFLSFKERKELDQFILYFSGFLGYLPERNQFSHIIGISNLAYQFSISIIEFFFISEKIIPEVFYSIIYLIAQPSQYCLFAISIIANSSRLPKLVHAFVQRGYELTHLHL